MTTHETSTKEHKEMTLDQIIYVFEGGMELASKNNQPISARDEAILALAKEIKALKEEK